MGLLCDIDPGSVIVLSRGDGSGQIRISLERKSGDRARLRIDAPDDVAIKRPERTKSTQDPPPRG